MPVSDTYPMAFSVCFSSLSWTLYQVHGFCFKIGVTFFQLKKEKGISARFFREAWEQSGQGFLKNEHPSAPPALIKRPDFDRARKEGQTLFF